MKKLYKLSLVTLLLGSMVYNTNSSSNIYLMVSPSISSLNNTKYNSDEYKGNSSIIGGAIGLGYDISQNISIEGALEYRHNNILTHQILNDSRTQEFNIISPILKISYHLYNDNNIKAFIGGGVGLSLVSGSAKINTSLEDPNNPLLSRNSIKLENKSFSSSFYAGVGKEFDNMSIALSYSFAYHGQTQKDKNELTLDIYLQSIALTMRFDI